MYYTQIWKNMIRGMIAMGVTAAFILPATNAKATCGDPSASYIGSVCATAASFCPRSYTELAGQLLRINEHTSLFSLLGCKWGGDCRTTFALPDMRGRASVGVGHGPGLTPIELGQRRGAESHSLTVNQLTQHNHTATFEPDANGEPVTGKLEAITSGAVRAAPAAGDLISGGGNDLNFGTGGLGAERVELEGLTISGGGAAGGTVSVSNTGASHSFNIQGPVLALTHCMVLEGLYPPRN